MIHHRQRSLAALVLSAAPLLAAPSLAGDAILALVNDEPITLEAYTRTLAGVHADAEVGATEPSVARRNPLELLDRLINVTLVLQEARAIGLDELPAFVETMRGFREETLSAALVAHVLDNLPPPAPEQVRQRYEDKVTEFEVSGLRFDRLEDAQSFVERLGDGQGFEFLGRLYVAEGRAADLQEHSAVPREELAPSVVEALAALEPGSASGPIPVGPVYAVVQLYGSRLREDPDARRDAEREVREAAGSRALTDHVKNLQVKHAKLDEQLFEGLDFDASAEDYAKLLEDTRELVRFDDGPPIRVADLARVVESRMFHGVEQAARSSRLNKAKRSTVDQMITERVILDEALRLGLDRTPEFLERMEETERSMLFAQFVARVLDPSITVADDEIRRYYDEHLGEFTEPEMVRLDALAFSSAQVAQRALEHLNAGADLKWMRANSSGLVPPQQIPEPLRFAGQVVTVASLDAAVREALTGAAAGDHRLYAENPARHHVLSVVDRVAPRPRAIDEVRGELQRRLFVEKRQDALDDWTARLREASQIEVRYDEKGLSALLGGAPAPPLD